jgi:EpsI family protein
VIGHLRFFVTTILLAGTGAFLHAPSHLEVIPARKTFESFPNRSGSWQGSAINIAPDVLRTLGPGDFLARRYREDRAGAPPVDLFIAYFPSQRSGDTIHSPRQCLPGAGWFPLQSSQVAVSWPGRDAIPANLSVMAKGFDRQVVLYWYWAHNRAVVSEYWAKFYLIEDSIRLRRSDGSLIRVSTELQPGENTVAAQGRLTSLLEQIMPGMEAYIPR